VIGSFRLIAAAGAGILAGSFFLFPAFHNSPLGRFRWAADEVFTGAGLDHALVFLGMALVIAYPYVWAGVVALTVGWSWERRERVPLVSQLACHLTGGGIVVAFGWILLLTGDAYVPRGVQCAAALVPIAIVGGMLAIARWARPRRRLPAITMVGFIPHLIMQPALALAVKRDGGWPEGYLLAACGAVVGLGGSVCWYLIEGIRERNMHRHSDVQ
jgi:hypothetical protein